MKEFISPPEIKEAIININNSLSKILAILEEIKPCDGGIVPKDARILGRKIYPDKTNTSGSKDVTTELLKELKTNPEIQDMLNTSKPKKRGTLAERIKNRK